MQERKEREDTRKEREDTRKEREDVREKGERGCKRERREDIKERQIHSYCVSIQPTHCHSFNHLPTHFILSGLRWSAVLSGPWSFTPRKSLNEHSHYMYSLGVSLALCTLCQHTEWDSILLGAKKYYIVLC